MELDLPTSASFAFQDLPQAPDDPIIGVTTMFKKDPSPVKLNLGVGAFLCEEGKLYVPKVVREVEQRLLNDLSLNKEYLPIIGNTHFNQLTKKVIFGEDSKAVKEKRVCTVQCLSGTGSLRVGVEFLAKHYPNKAVYVPIPTWGNHPKVFNVGGLEVKTYRYYDPTTRGLDYQGLLDDLNLAPPGAVALFHACAHNPTGVDPTQEQWNGIHQVIRDKNMLPFFDCAYLGFASGSLDTDAYAIRLFAGDGQECFVAQSYAKNMGLYGERIGALSIVCGSESIAMRVESQLKLIIRPMYSSPPTHGAAIVATILGDKNLFNEWTIDIKRMADKILHVRQLLYEALKAHGTPGDWSHIIKQIGMFTFTGLSKEQVAFITSKFHIYMTFDGRISMASVNTKNVPYLADSIHHAVMTILK